MVAGGDTPYIGNCSRVHRINIMQSTQNSATNAQAAALNKPLLKEGSTGTAVQELQKLLNHWGYPVTIDGNFGRITRASVEAFQARVFLTQDGIVGNNTWQALYTGAPVNMPTLKRGSQGEAVKTVQIVLSRPGDYQGSIDGIFGAVTETAVRKFQARVGLVSDGIVGSKTWYAFSKTQVTESK
jgi:peptidoglycan hydrolase-like protein with peptidoglycan-binding domain